MAEEKNTNEENTTNEEQDAVESAPVKKNDVRRDAIIKTVIIIAIIVVVNIITNQLFTRVDLTKNKSYTLSQVSDDIIKNLNDNIVIKAYVSENLPPPVNNLGRQVKDVLEDYRSLSDGKLNYEYINISLENESDQPVIEEAKGYGIQPVQFQVTNQGKMEVVNGMVGIVLFYKGKTESIPFVQSPENLEYDITSRILQISTEKKKKIGFVNGHGEYDLSSMQRLNQALSAQYDIQAVDLSLNKPVPDDVDVLLVLGPKSEIPEAQKYLIDQFIMRGKNVAFLMNKVAPNFQQQIVMGEPVNTGLDDMLANYGIKVSDDLVRDLQCGYIQQRSQMGMNILQPYFYFPKITDINHDIGAFSKLNEVILQFASSLDTSVAAGKNLTITPLFKSSEKSGIATGFYILNENQFNNLPQEAIDTLFGLSGLLMGAVYEGTFTSFYNDKPQPQDTSEGSATFNVVHKSQSEKPGRILAVGDADFIDENNAQTIGNLVFFLNMVEYLADDAGLSEIRGKAFSEAPIEDESDDTKRFVRYFNLIFPPVLVLLVGFFIWDRRKSRRKKLQAEESE
ncbi:MAG: GldG family protein [Ignavibacteriae bacterium]|nr:GldG family protein [Ignavibacteriota bacterium]MCB9242567.1 GldG family protein [Ignavibacteriales bacterium]